MRSAVGIFGLVCGVIVVALVARYGYRTTDVEFDAWVMGFLFGVIAAFGLAGHAFAVFLWRHNKAASLATGIVAVAALGLNLSNSLGAIADRSDVSQQERIEKNLKIRAAEAELMRLTALRDAMPAFVPTDEATVRATKTAAEAATLSKERECAAGAPRQRGNNCRDREADERAANAALASATASKAATDRASKLEADANAQRKLLSELGPIVAVNAQGNTLAKLFRLPDEEAGFVAAAQQFGTAVVVELIILMCLIGWEVSRPAPRLGRVTAEPSPATLSPPSPPKLVATSSEKAAEPIPRIMTAALDRADGQRVDLEACFHRYVADCKVEGRAPVEPNEFMNAMARFCKTAGIKTKVMNDTLYLMDVCLGMSVDKPAYVTYSKQDDPTRSVRTRGFALKSFGNKS